MAAYTYLPWVRQGLIGAAGAGTVAAGRLGLKAQVTISGGGGGTPAVDVLLFGPGDVTGFDTRQVIRIEPAALTADVEPNYFPLIEFDRPDFPWMFSPAAPDGRNQLAPWICLVAVERRDGVEITPGDGRSLPVLMIATAAHAELPDLTEAWAWAHAQVAAVTSDADLETALKTQPDRTLSRLLCPRRLKPKTAYFACVVPTYKGGVQAGLGETVVDAQALDPAWTIAAQPDQIRLPVYYSWEFATGVEGDFEALVWQLERRRLTVDEVGTRKLEIGTAGYGLPATAPVDLEGALGPEADAADPRVGPSAPYQQRLQALVNETTSVPPLPVLPPPIYGRWHALQRAIPDPIAPGRTRDRSWLRELNLDPRYRVAAGVGAQIVREQQEQLMASAWDQVGDVERANQMIRQAQLARAASVSIHQERLGKLDATTFLLTTGPAQPRVRYIARRSGDERTARGHVRDSVVGAAVTSTQFRRVFRARGPLARRFGLTRTSRSDVVTGLNDGRIRAVPLRWPTRPGLATMESVIDRSPCRTNPLTLAHALVETRPPEPLIAALENFLQVFSNRRAEIATFTSAVQERLLLAAKHASAARDFLRTFAARISQPRSRYFDLVVSLYKPAMALIVDLILILIRGSRGFGANPPQAIEELNHAASALPTLDELRDMNFGLAVLLHVRRVEPCEEIARPQKPPLDIDELKKLMLDKLNPAVTIPARVASLVQAPGWEAAELDEVLAAPVFPAAMYKTLAAVSQDWLLPGLERVPANTLALLSTNPRFIEAFMVGLNHEMSRELLWRGYPTDQRGTYFRQFWDPSGRFEPPVDEAARTLQEEQGKDIPPIDEWGDSSLGTHVGKPRQSLADTAAKPAMARVVLLIRGELLRRYPRAMIYLAQAQWSLDVNNKKVLPRSPTATEKHPMFRGELAPDIQLLGFDVDPEAARGSEQPSADPTNDGAGWFVVIQQPPTEPRYGLDETAATSPEAQWTWRDLAWVHVNLTAEAGYVKLGNGVKAAFPSAARKGPQGQTWLLTPETTAGASQPDAAQVACITQQGPVRIAVHASDLL
jgi:hypothetical protein